MKLVCPECKNDVNLALYPTVAPEHVIECDVCGITLLVESIEAGQMVASVVDEGK